MPVEWIGSKGLFVAMIGSLLWTELFCWLKRKNLVIKMPDGVPPAVQESFAALIPALLVMILVLVIRIVFENTHYNTIHQFIYEVVATPVRHYGTSYFGALMTVFSITILWSVGINSGSMINGIIRPLWMENQTDNIAAIQAGTTPPHIITEQFFDMIWMGGAGATLSLVIAMLIFARSKNMREVARLGAGASVFNINEPILFGLPVIMNPIMLIPFNLVPCAAGAGERAVRGDENWRGRRNHRGVYPVDAAAGDQRFYRHRAPQRQRDAAYQSADWRHAVSAFYAHCGQAVPRGGSGDRYANRHDTCKTGVKHVGNYRHLANGA